MIVMGVDPGAPGKSGGTGIVVAQGDRLLAHDVVTSPDVNLQDRSGTVVWEYLTDLHDRLARIAASIAPAQVELVAVEDVHSPGGHARGRDGHLIDPRWLIAAASAAGVTVAWAHTRRIDCVLVPPAGNGDLRVEAYPEPIRSGPRSRLRHARSAWDVAKTGRFLHRTNNVEF